MLDRNRREDELPAMGLPAARGHILRAAGAHLHEWVPEVVRVFLYDLHLAALGGLRRGWPRGSCHICDLQLAPASGAGMQVTALGPVAASGVTCSGSDDALK